MNHHMTVRKGAKHSDLVEIEFDDNRHASTLYGERDRTLSRIEKRLGLALISRGNVVQIIGDASKTKKAQEVLNALYDRIRDGEVPDDAIVSALLRQVDEQGACRNGRATGTRKARIRARNAAQDAYVEALTSSELVFGVGPAGTGKTYLAVAHAATLLESGQVSRLILTRPAVEAGEKLGFLPGDLKEKVDPYLRPLYDALYDMFGDGQVERLLTSGAIEVAPLAFMRGRTLKDAAVILDEAQNTTSMQMKMFLTRMGENSRMIVTGDPTQVDLPRNERSGLVEALEILEGVEGVTICRFAQGDVVRHELVGRIVQAYEAR